MIISIMIILILISFIVIYELVKWHLLIKLDKVFSFALNNKIKTDDHDPERYQSNW